MPSSSSSSRRRSSHGRYDHRDESFQGPIDSILYMLTGACSTVYHLISTTTSTSRTNPQHWDSDDDIEEDDGTLLTETTSYSSSDRPSKNSGSRRRRRKSVQGTTSHVPPPRRSRSHSVRAGMRQSSPPPMSFGIKADIGGSGKYRSRSLSKSHFGRRSEEELRMGSSRSATTKQVLRENTEIHIKQSDQEDDISAISAGTLEHMEKMYILQQANKTLLLNKQHQQQQQQVQKQEKLQQGPQETAFDNGFSKHHVGLVASSPTAANVLPSTHGGSFHNKENLHLYGPYATSPDRSCTSRKSQISSHAVLSMASSTGTSEFESIWHRPIQRLQQQPQQSQQQQMMKFQTQGQEREQVQSSMESSLYRQKLDHHGNRHHDRLDVDDNPVGMASEALLLHEKNKKKNSSSSRSKSAMLYETPNTRKMKRRIQMDWIGTIDEGIYSDEEEI